jgi:hypothetical protein
MTFFKCKHPASRLAVKTDSTEEYIDEYVVRVIHHLFCRKCMADVDIKYAKTIGGVSDICMVQYEAFLARRQDSAGNK